MSIKETGRRIEELFKKWRKLQPLGPEDEQRFNKKVRLEWNYNSNHIEGNTLTYNETAALILEKKEEGIHPKRDYMEMKAHDLAISKVREFAADKERKLTEADIRGLNKLILKEPFWKEAVTADGGKTQKKVIPGIYKKQPNHVRTETGEIFKFAQPHDVPAKMKELIDWFNKEIEKPTLTISRFIAELHHRFIIIHPFDDGNGRIARLWVNYVLLRFGYPPLVIKSKDKRNCFAALQKADGGDMESFTTYLASVLIYWLEIGIKAAKGEDISEPDDVDKKIDIFKKEKKAKGFEKIKPLSKEVIEELHERLFIPLFETFESKFKQIDELFYSNQISFETGIIDSKDWRKTLKEYVEKWETGTNNTIKLTISYEKYKGAKPFDMAVYLEVVVYEFEYSVAMKSALYSWDSRFISERKPYSRILTEQEIEKFINKGKEDFFNKLEKEAKLTDK